MQPLELLAGTADGLRRIRINRDTRASTVASGLSGNAIRGIAVHPDEPETIYVAAGLRGWGLHRSLDGGGTFEPIGFQDKWVWDVTIDEMNPARLLIGTEPPMLYESLDRGESWRDFPAIDAVESRSRWTFFHAPFHAGHLHGIGITAARPERIVVGVEHGGLLRTDDHGETWQDVMPGADLHRIEIDPTNPDRIFAGAGNGLFVSTDGGKCWVTMDQLRGRYVHGIVIDPRDVRRMFVYIDSANCPIYRTVDGGSHWEEAGLGLPASRPADPVRLHPDEPETLFYTGDCEQGSQLFMSRDSGDTWTEIDLELPKVWRLETLPV